MLNTHKVTHDTPEVVHDKDDDGEALKRTETALASESTPTIGKYARRLHANGTLHASPSRSRALRPATRRGHEQVPASAPENWQDNEAHTKLQRASALNAITGTALVGVNDLVSHLRQLSDLVVVKDPTQESIPEDANYVPKLMTQYSDKM